MIAHDTNVPTAYSATLRTVSATREKIMVLCKSRATHSFEALYGTSFVIFALLSNLVSIPTWMFLTFRLRILTRTIIRHSGVLKLKQRAMNMKQRCPFRLSDIHLNDLMLSEDPDRGGKCNAFTCPRLYGIKGLAVISHFMGTGGRHKII